MLRIKNWKPVSIVLQISAMSFFTGSVLVLLHSLSYAGNEVTLNLSAKVEESCSLDREDETVELNSEGTATVNFVLDCNNPFSYSLKSTNGALVHSGSQDVGANSDTIQSEVDYKTTFAVPTLQDGDTNSLSQECGSSDLKDDTAVGGVIEATCDTAAFAGSGTSVAIGQAASLTVSIDGAYRDGLLDNVPLLSGTFQDTLVLTVSTPP